MATVASRHRAATLAPSASSRALPILAVRALADARVRTTAFAALFALVAYIQPIAYRHTYPTLHERIAFARSFADNKAVVLFYGKAYDLLTVGGYTAWRVGGTLAIFASVFGVLAAVRALRAEEDAGRTELVLATPVSRRTGFAAALAAVAVGALALWLAVWLGCVLGGLNAAGSAYLALAVASIVPVFAGVGALSSQIAPSRRVALQLGSAVFAVAFLLRIVADTASGALWLHWLTPLGWAEEMRALTGPRPAVLLVPAAATALMLAAAWRLSAARDVGVGLLGDREHARPSMRLPSSPTAHALREERSALLVWMTALTALGLVLGVVSKSVSSISISHRLQRALERLGSGPRLTPPVYIGFAFSLFVVVICVLVVSQLAAARHEEADGRLETLIALPVGRRRWLGGRLALTAAAAVSVAVALALATWLGAVSQGVSVSLATTLQAAGNCLPVAGLFCGITALAYAVLPRAGIGIGYALLILAYVWQLFGSLLGMPKWLVDVTPFAHIAVIPSQSFRAGAASIMLGVGAAAGALALWSFGRRDLSGA